MRANLQTTVLFFVGLTAALGLAAWQYSLAPQGVLLYTPVANDTNPNYTSSSFLGFFLGALALCTVSTIVAALSYLIGNLFKRKTFIGVAKSSMALTIWFGLLCFMSVLTERYWP
ncbi:MAG TPA: hypothetical protein VGE50_09905 [Gammaproteobacteria bacterium]